MTNERRGERPSTAQQQQVSLPKQDSQPELPVKNHAASPPTESWRELAQRIQRESDPNVMIELTQELMAKLDAEKAQKQGRRNK